MLTKELIQNYVNIALKDENVNIFIQDAVSMIIQQKVIDYIDEILKENSYIKMKVDDFVNKELQKLSRNLTVSFFESGK